MKDWFFYQEKGKTMGPLAAEDMRQRIRDGRLRLFDLVFREGESIWKMAMEFHEFRDEFKKNTAAKDRPWIVLQKKPDGDGSEFVTTGPFTRAEVKEAILTGKISYSDYVWRTGFKEWRRISKLEEFNDKIKKRADPPLPPIPSESPEEMLKNVVEMKRPDLRQGVREPVPEEAITPDLVQHPDLERMPPARTERRARPRRKSETAWLERDRRSRTKSKVLWMDWVIVGILMVSLGVGAFYVSRSMNQAKRDEFPKSRPPLETGTLPETPESGSVVEFNPPAESPPGHAGSSAPEPPSEAVEKVPSHAPASLTLTVHPQGPNQPRIEIRTDGSPDFPVHVQVMGMSGQVADAPGFYRYIRLKPTGDPMRTLDLSALKLPPGKFVVMAETGELHKEALLAFGTGETAYKQNVARVRKMYAYAIWKERLDLIRFSQRLEERVVLSLKAKKFSTKGLEAVAAIKRGNRVGYILFREWWELKELYDVARREPAEVPLDRLTKLRHRLAEFSVWKVK
jgi:hypothetical protein